MCYSLWGPKESHTTERLNNEYNLNAYQSETGETNCDTAAGRNVLQHIPKGGRSMLPSWEVSRAQH